MGGREGEASSGNETSSGNHPANHFCWDGPETQDSCPSLSHIHYQYSSLPSPPFPVVYCLNTGIPCTVHSTDTLEYTSMFLYIPIYTYIYLHIPLYTSIYLYIHICTSIFLHIPLYAYIYLYIHLCTSIYLHIHLCT